MVLKNYVFLLGTCQKVHVTVSECLNIVNCIDSFLSGQEINPLASQKTVPIISSAKQMVLAFFGDAA
jgi:hypothetical protein